MSHQTDNTDLLASTKDRALRLRQAIARQEAELLSDRLLEPAVREAGLKAVRCVAECASRLAGLVKETHSE